MLKKTNRLSKKKDFELVKKQGKIIQTPLFGFLYLKEGEIPKFGFVISKKISKKAVDRNKIRRVVAESLKKNLDKFPIGIQGIILAKRELLGKKFEDVDKEICSKIISNL